MIDNNKNLYYLDELPNYKVASDNCDVRGWEVIDAYNQHIGKVENLLVNKQSKRVVYLEVEVDENLIVNNNRSPHATICTAFDESIKDRDVYIVVPIGTVNLNKEKRQLITTQVCYNNLGETSIISDEYHIDPDYVGRVLQ